MGAQELGVLGRTVYRHLLRSAHLFDRQPVLKALIGPDFKKLPESLEAVVNAFLGGASLYVPAPLLPRSVAEAVRVAFRFPPEGHNLDDGLLGLRYLKTLAAIGAKHDLAGPPAKGGKLQGAPDVEQAALAGCSERAEPAEAPEAGVVLVAHPMQTGDFARSVILLCSYGPAAGAAGVILNLPPLCQAEGLRRFRKSRQRMEAQAATEQRTDITRQIEVALERLTDIVERTCAAVNEAESSGEEEDWQQDEPQEFADDSDFRVKVHAPASASQVLAVRPHGETDGDSDESEEEDEREAMLSAFAAAMDVNPEWVRSMLDNASEPADPRERRRLEALRASIGPSGARRRGLRLRRRRRAPGDTEPLEALGSSPVYLGGPGSGLQVLHQEPDLGGVQVLPPWEDGPGVYYGGLHQAARAVGLGALEQERVRLFEGEATWMPGQLEDELATGAWVALRLPRAMLNQLAHSGTLLGDCESQLAGGLGGDQYAFTVT
ncbi:hypothetical protein WJX81_001416 [Elliptochloris bilobata]|uniref:Uncharacterized protein n=1 Tax=Elliptochloris bilobata TaxID=381761 RepID=A0AAW1S1F2_9CHLO